jgi:hypothetical protein
MIRMTKMPQSRPLFGGVKVGSTGAVIVSTKRSHVDVEFDAHLGKRAKTIPDNVPIGSTAPVCVDTASSVPQNSYSRPSETPEYLPWRFREGWKN